MEKNRITFRAFLLGLFFAGAFAWMTVKGERSWFIYTNTQVPVLPYCLLLAAALAVNPVLRWIRLVRPFSATELLTVFVMGAVSAGVPTIGLASHLIPVVSGLSNPHWNTAQARWDVFVEPYLNERFFIAAPGTRRGARRLRDAHRAWHETRSVLRAAEALRTGRRELAAAERGFAGAEGGRGEEVRALRHRVAVLRRTLQKAEHWWRKYEGRFDFQEVLRTFPAEAQRRKALVDARRRALDALKREAFDRIEEFRRGLPQEMRARPGLLYVEGEGLANYFARLRRLRHGLAALTQLRRADEAFARAVASRGAAGPDVASRLARAIALLKPIADTESLAERKRKIEAAQGHWQARRHEAEREVALLHKLRRYARAADYAAIGKRVRRAEACIGEADDELGVLWVERYRRIAPQLAAAERVARTHRDLEDLLVRTRALGPAALPRLQDQLWDAMAAFPRFDASLRRFLVGEIDWGLWLRPLFHWAVLILTTYLVLMSFNVLVFRQWAYSEKLVYPLAELPLALAGSGDPTGPAGTAPAVFRNGLFWAGFLTAVCLLGWNHTVQPSVPGVGPIPLNWPLDAPIPILRLAPVTITDGRSGFMGCESAWGCIALNDFAVRKPATAAWVKARQG